MTREEQRIEEAKNRFSDDQIYPISKIHAFIEGAEWEHKRLVEKAREYLESTLKHDLGYYGAAEFADTFIKAMEE